MRDKLGLKELDNEISLASMTKMEQPMLVTRTNSVSGKLFIASEMQEFNTIGMDAVAASVNDLLASGARPLLFYDNITCARPKLEKIKEIESGIEQACIQGSIRFAGSEVKELPDIFSYDQYDLVGFAAGIRDNRQQQAAFKDGDVIIGLPSNGLHNNGYVAARKKLYLSKATMEVYYESLGATLGDLLMVPTKMYRTAMEAAMAAGLEIKSSIQVAHGGLDRAVRLLLRNRAGAVIKQKNDSMPPLYEMLHKDGNISIEQMRQIFNMGIGMLLIVSEEDADTMVEVLEGAGETPNLLGLVERDSYNIRYIMG